LISCGFPPVPVLAVLLPTKAGFRINKHHPAVAPSAIAVAPSQQNRLPAGTGLLHSIQLEIRSSVKSAVAIGGRITGTYGNASAPDWDSIRLGRIVIDDPEMC